MTFLNYNVDYYYLIMFILIPILFIKYNLLKKINIFSSTLKLYNVIKQFEIEKNLIIIVDDFWKENNNNLYSMLSKYIIDIEDSDTFIKRLLEINRNDDIHIIIYSTGGSVSSSDMIVNILLQHKGAIHTYIPLYVFSAATYISLIGDEIYMNEISQMGPVDAQYNINDDDDELYVGVKSIINYVNNKGIKNSDDKLIIHYYESKKYHEDSIRNLHRILDNKYSRRTVKNIIKELNNGIYPHSKPFSLEELKKIGLNINKYIPDDINNIFTLLTRLEYYY